MFVLALPTQASAETGEMRMGFDFDNELAFLHHPQLDRPSSGAREYIPRAGLLLSYGFTNWLEVGVALRASLPIDTVSEHVGFAGYDNAELYSRYWDMMVPLVLNLRYSRGSDITMALQGQGGISVTRWDTQKLLSSDPGTSYPFETGVSWDTQPFWRAALLLEWRPMSSLSLGIGPYVGRTLKSGDWHTGLNLAISYMFGFGFS